MRTEFPWRRSLKGLALAGAAALALGAGAAVAQPSGPPPGVGGPGGPPGGPPPAPGGKTALIAELTTVAGLPSAVAVSAVLLFRLLAFWLPVPVGWVALNYLERKQAL